MRRGMETRALMPQTALIIRVTLVEVRKFKYSTARVIDQYLLRKIFDNRLSDTQKTLRKAPHISHLSKGMRVASNKNVQLSTLVKK